MNPHDFLEMGIIPPESWCSICESYHSPDGPHNRESLLLEDAKFWFDKANEQRDRANQEYARAEAAEAILNKIASTHAGRQLIRDAQNEKDRQLLIFALGAVTGLIFKWLVTR